MVNNSFCRVVQVGPPDITIWAGEEIVLAELDGDLVCEVAVTEEKVLGATLEADAILAWGAAPLTRGVIESLTNCMIIARYGIGVDSVDIAAATEYGIAVTNVPDYCVEEVSDHALMMILACNRKLIPFHNSLSQGRWEHNMLHSIGRLREQTLGVIGMGRIGRAMVRKARALGLQILVHDPYVDENEIQNCGAEPADIDVLLHNADYVSLHTPLVPETYHLISEQEFRLMKASSYLINTSRGRIVDEKALIKALQADEIAGAALDVFEEEPPASDNPLLQMHNVIITPHMADYSDTSRAEVRHKAATEVLRVLSGKSPLNIVNHAVLEHARFVKEGGNYSSTPH